MAGARAFRMVDQIGHYDNVHYVLEVRKSVGLGIVGGKDVGQR